VLYINPKSRVPLESFRTKLYHHIKKNNLRYSDQRERVLKILYSQSHSVSIEYLVNKLNEETSGAGYTTVLRHLKLFKDLGMLRVLEKTQKSYILNENIFINDSYLI